MFIIINTTDIKNTEIILAKAVGNFLVKRLKGERRQSEKLLAGIEALLKKSQVGLKQIKGIGVVNGPAAFVALRIGVATANALGYALRVPVVDAGPNEFKNESELVAKVLGKIKQKRVGHFYVVAPQYGREPNVVILKK